MQWLSRLSPGVAAMTSARKFLGAKTEMAAELTIKSSREREAPSPETLRRMHFGGDGAS
jgi:hypothetical protein